MTSFSNIQSVVVSFVNRDNVPTALVIDGTHASADLLADVTVDDDGLTAAIEITGQVPNAIGYSFKSLEDYRLSFVRNEEDGRPVKKRQEFGPLGKVVAGAITVAILVPFISILWAWAVGVVRGMGGLW